MLTCDMCQVTNEDVQECNDPYSLDVNNEEVLMNLCDGCYAERAADI